jgi:hypothetical protein
MSTEHEKFRELSALVNTGTLTASEWAECREHLRLCEECREVHDQYLFMVKEGIPLLAAHYSDEPEEVFWDDTEMRKNLSARVQAEKAQTSYKPGSQSSVGRGSSFLRRMAVNPLARIGVAACLLVAVVFGAYRLGNRTQAVRRPQVSMEKSIEKLANEKRSLNDSLQAELTQSSELQNLISQKEQELTKLRSVLRTREDRTNELMRGKTETEEQLRAVSQQRDVVSARLRDAEQAYDKVKAELTSVRSESDKVPLRIASLESKIEELSTVNLEQERRLQQDEQYLASDRDIRELMGARQLYIADVFDVSSDSSTRKPFGRVFYTQGKSLIFYAFDLDRQAGIKTASTFQAWGSKESSGGKPRNLGILYMDNEANRRWVLRCDDPQQLAEIDAVFVTVEPHGGSRKPTSKPYLFAFLRKEVNHP